MNDFEKRKDTWKEQDAKRPDHDRLGQVGTGIILLLIGIVALLRNNIPDFPKWIFSWQMLLIVMGLFIGIRHHFRGAAWFVLLLIGGTFLINNYFLDVGLRRHLWPLILIAIGAFFIFRSRSNSNRMCYEKKNTGQPGESLVQLSEERYNQHDFIDATSIFGGTKKNILTKDFRGGDIVNVFGGTELNLTQSDINGVATLEITTIFGGTKLIVPSHWSVKSEVVTIFGGIEDKRQLPSASDSSEKILLLKGTVIFGGIDIKCF